jgi:hypothetical protein
MSKSNRRKIVITLPEYILEELDEEVRKMRKEFRDVEYNRSDLIESAICGKITQRANSVEERHRLYKFYLSEAEPLKKKTLQHKELGETAQARSSSLKAAAKELEALSILENPNEEILRSALIEIVMLIKDGTGYIRLPDIPLSINSVESI